jgi:hypothetical protein
VKYIAACLLVFWSALSAAPATDPLHDILARHRVKSEIVWRTQDEDLLCAVVEHGNGADVSEKLACYSNAQDAPVASFEVEPGLIQLQVLGLVGGPLIASWGTGSGYYFVAYAFSAGKVVKVWDGGSYLPFEWFTVDATGAATVIALAQPRWSETANGGKEKIAGRGELFLWDGGTFQPLGTVPWAKRFEAALTTAKAATQRPSPSRQP